MWTALAADQRGRVRARIHATYIIVDEAGEEAIAEVAGRAGKVVQARGDGAVAAVEAELDDITHLGVKGVGFERAVSNSDADGLGTGDGSQDGGSENGLEGRHCCSCTDSDDDDDNAAPDELKFLRVREQ